MIYRFETEDREEAMLILKRDQYVNAVEAIKNQLRQWDKYGCDLKITYPMTEESKSELVMLMREKLLEISADELEE